MANFLSLGGEEQVTSVLSMISGKKAAQTNDKRFVILQTQKGIIKKVESKDFEDVRRSGIKAINLDKGDTLRWASIVRPGDEIILSTRSGQAIRFKEKDARAMGRAAKGVRAMRIKKNDEIIGMNVIPKAATKIEILSVSDLGYGKKTLVAQYRVQKRGGSGIKTFKVTPKTGALVSVQVIADEAAEIIAISQKGQVIRAPLEQIPSLSRATQGVRVMKIESGDKVASITIL